MHAQYLLHVTVYMCSYYINVLISVDRSLLIRAFTYVKAKCRLYESITSLEATTLIVNFDMHKHAGIQEESLGPGGILWQIN